MSGTVEKFDKRLGRVTAKHRAMSRGYSFHVEKSGLVSVRPKRGYGFPFGAIALTLAVALLFKAVVLANYGPAKYDEKIDMLKSGTLVESAGAWLLEPGAATVWLASVVDGVIR